MAGVFPRAGRACCSVSTHQHENRERRAAEIAGRPRRAGPCMQCTCGSASRAQPVYPLGEVRVGLGGEATAPRSWGTVRMRPRQGRGSSLGEEDWRGMGRTGLGQMAAAVHGAPERHGVSGPTGSPLSLCQLSIKDVRKFLGFCTFSGTRPLVFRQKSSKTTLKTHKTRVSPRVCNSEKLNFSHFPSEVLTQVLKKNKPLT